MNNCYLWVRGGVDHVIDAHVEEQDRSLPAVEVPMLHVVRPAFQSLNQHMLDDEVLPELTDSADSYSSNNEEYGESSSDTTPTNEESLKHTAQAQRDVRNASRIPVAASVASSSLSPMRTPHRKKFLSRSHNSLVFRPPDYSKVESKVKKYIASMREQQKQRRQRSQSLFNSAAPVLLLNPSSALKEPEEVVNLKRQLIDQEVRVEVLQEDHDRLLLHNARLQNMLEEMRTKLRILHSQQQHRQPKQQERRTNSPQPEVDKQSLSLESLFSTGGDGTPSATQLGLTYQYQTLSITPTSYLDLPPLGQPNRKTSEDYETSSCDSSWHSVGRLNQNPMKIETHVEQQVLGNKNITSTFLEEPVSERNDKHPDLQLLKQLKEITLAAIEVRDQTRSILFQMR